MADNNQQPKDNKAVTFESLSPEDQAKLLDEAKAKVTEEVTNEVTEKLTKELKPVEGASAMSLKEPDMEKVAEIEKRRNGKKLSPEHVAFLQRAGAV